MTSTTKLKPQWSIPASAQTTEDPLLDCLVLLTEHYGNPCSSDALTAGLPMTGACLTPGLFPQAAGRAGLSARLLRKPLDQISSMLFPCVLLLRDQKACLLHRMGSENGRNVAVIQLPENGGETEIPLEELEAIYTGYTILVKMQYRGDRSVDLHLHNTQEHWLKVMLRDAMPIYRDALLASLVINLFALVSPLFMMNVYDKIVPNLAFESLWVLASGAALAFIFDFTLRSLRSSLIDIAGKKIDIIVSSRLFAKLMGMPLANRSPSVGGMAKQMSEFDSVRDMLTSATLTTLVDLPFALFFLFVIYVVSGDLAAVPFFAGLLIIGYTFWVQPRLREAIEESNKFASLKNGHLVESLSAIESIKASVAEGLVQRTWQQMIAHTANWNLKVKKISQSVSYLATFVTQMTSIVVVILGVYRLSQGELSMGGIIAAVMLSGRAVAPMAQLANLLTRTNQTASALRQLDTIMNAEDEFADKGHLISRKRLSGHIQADNIGFTYPNSEKPVIYPSSLTINAGERIAIIGKNGSGKTSLLKMMAGLFHPSQGSLRYDGIDSKQIHPADLRHNVGYMPQDITLFHGSIRDNIMFGTRQVSEHQLIRAVQLSGVGMFTSKDSEGLDKEVGELGETLSRGQRQSVALARAILNDPPILVMDEPTASMDATAEKQFTHAMMRVSSERTLLLVTHKMSLLNLVDRIIVVDNGRIVLDGPREQVMAKLHGHQEPQRIQAGGQHE